MRPTGARVRQSLFDILAPRLTGAAFLDLCAGSGAVGLEALSRGAARAVFVDKARSAAALVEKNLRLSGATSPRGTVILADALAALKTLARKGERFDIVFFDPPYESPLYEAVLERAGRGELLAAGGLLIAEHFHKRALPETIGGLARTRQVKVSDHVLSFYEVP